MVHDEHSPYHENISAYALDALDVEDIPALEAHLQTCASCRNELAGYRAVGKSLLTALPPQQPPAALRQRLQNRLPKSKKVQRPRLAWSFPQIAFGLALVFLLGLNLISLRQSQILQLQQTQLIHQIQNDQMALAMLSYPNVQSLPINGENVSGTLLLDKTRNTAVLIAWNLPSLTDQQTYQIWLVDPQGNRVSAGLFRPQSDHPYTTEAIASNFDYSNFSGIGVTVEPAGGSDGPTGPRVFKVDF